MSSIDRLPIPKHVPLGVTRLPNDDGTPYSTAFANKLTFDERCFAVALYITRHSIPTIAAFMKVHPDTIRAMVRRSSRHYKLVREEVEKLGQADFLSVYLGKFPQRHDEFKKFARDNIDIKQRQAVDPDKSGYYPDKGANNKHGNCTVNTHSCAVYWEDEPRGWYCRMPDTIFPEDPDLIYGPFGTSNIAYERVLSLLDRAVYREPAYVAARRLRGDSDPWRTT